MDFMRFRGVALRELGVLLCRKRRTESYQRELVQMDSGSLTHVDRSAYSIRLVRKPGALESSVTGRSVSDGAVSAWLYDVLRESGRRNGLPGLYGSIQFVSDPTRVFTRPNNSTY